MKFLTHDGISYFWGKIKSYIDTKYNELFQSVSNGKKSVANAITGKGVATNATDTFATMATNIGKIKTGVETGDATAIETDVLSGKTYYKDNVKKTGTMTNIGNSTKIVSTLNDSTTGRSSNIVNIYTTPSDNAIHTEFIPPQGYYDGVNSKISLRLWGVSPEHVAAGQPIGSLANPWLKGTYNGLSTVRGSVKSYYAYAGQNIQSGDFVKYITGVAGLGTGDFSLKQIFNKDRIVKLFSVVAISQTKVALLYGEGTQLYVVIGDLNGVDLTLGTPVSLNVSSMYYTHAMAKMGNKLLVLNYGGQDDRIQMQVYTISGNTLNRESLNINYYTYNAAYHIQFLHVINDSTFLFVAQTGQRLTYEIVKYNGSSFTRVKADILRNAYASGVKVSVSPSGNILHVLAYGTSTSYISRYSFTDTNLTYLDEIVITNTEVVSDSTAQRIVSITNTHSAIIKTSSNLITLYLFANNSATYLQKISFGVNGNMKIMNVINIGNNKWMCIYSSSTQIDKLTLNARVMTYDGTNISLGTNRVLSLNTQNGTLDYGGSAILVGQKVITLASAEYGGGTFVILNAPSTTIDTYNYIYETQIAKANNNNEIQGVAHSNATGGTLSGANAGHNQATNVTSITSP